MKLFFSKKKNLEAMKSQNDGFYLQRYYCDGKKKYEFMQKGKFVKNRESIRIWYLFGQVGTYFKIPCIKQEGA